MKKNKFKFKNPKLAFAILLIVLFAVFLLYYHFVISPIFVRNNFVNKVVEIADENEEPIFNIQKIILYSNATVIDNSDDLSLENLSINQYSDISIFIDNRSHIAELTNENTIKELYIDNISFSESQTGTKLLNYKNHADFGKYHEILNPENGRIDFNIIHTNEENETADYAKPSFYTDCSNPMTLGFLNKDIRTNYSISGESNTVDYSGKVLQQANIPIEEVNYTVNFKIHIVNNLNQKFVYDMKLNVDLNDENGGIYNGYVLKGKQTSGKEYEFFKEV